MFYAYFLIAGYVLRWKIARHELGRAAGWHFDANNPVQPTASSIRRLHAEPSLGLIVNKDNTHWTAIRREHGVYWLLDSVRAAPIRMTEGQVIAYVKRYRNAFLVQDAALE